MIISQKDYIKTLKKPQLCDLNIQKTIENFNEELFGPYQYKIERETFDTNLSKSLCLNGDVIGGYLLGKYSMLNCISDINYHVNNGTLSDLKFYINQDFLNKYKNKIGILSDFIYIDKTHKGNNYADILIDYSKSLGDYVWGLSVPDETTEYWTSKQKRIKVLEYKDDTGLVILSTTEL